MQSDVMGFDIIQCEARNPVILGPSGPFPPGEIFHTKRKFLLPFDTHSTLIVP